MYPYDNMTFTGYQPQFTGYQPTYTKPVIPQNQNTQLNTFLLVDTNNKRVASFAFILVVHKSATDSDTVYSESDLAYANEVLNNLQSVGAYADALNNLNAKVNRIQMTYISSEERINFNNPA